MINKTIPIVDCAQGGIVAHGKEIFDAISTVGFVYLKNIGIPEETVSKIFELNDTFFTLPPEQKQKFARPTDYEREGIMGWVGPNVERLNPGSAAELREAFNFCPSEKLRAEIDAVVPEFNETLKMFCDSCWTISMEILRVLAINLGLEENFFDKTHCLGTKENPTGMRLLNYPPLPANIKPGTVRCGEHSDYGTITLLWQDEVGGLEISRRDGSFVPATPVPNAVLVNTGDLLQHWTSDRIKAVRHRVLIPANQTQYNSARRSFAFFVHPNDNVVVKPLDGSDKYEPVIAREHLMNRFKKAFDY